MKKASWVNISKIAVESARERGGINSSDTSPSGIWSNAGVGVRVFLLFLLFFKLHYKVKTHLSPVV
jgi:hypothetical protein